MQGLYGVVRYCGVMFSIMQHCLLLLGIVRYDRILVSLPNFSVSLFLCFSVSLFLCFSISLFLSSFLFHSQAHACIMFWKIYFTLSIFSLPLSQSLLFAISLWEQMFYYSFTLILFDQTCLSPHPFPPPLQNLSTRYSLYDLSASVKCYFLQLCFLVLSSYSPKF